MRKLLSLLAVAALLPASANADVLKNVNIKGEIQTIASDARHNMEGPVAQTDFYNRGASARVLAGLSADLVEDVTANLMFQYANVWGNDLASGKNVQTYWNQVSVVEANVVLHNLFCNLEATVGRQFYGDEDSAVLYFGPNHYNAEANGYVRSLDAAKVTYADDFQALTLIAGRVNESTIMWPNNTGFNPYEQQMPISGLDGASLFGADWKANLTDALTAQAYIYDFRYTGEAAEEMGKHFGFWGVKGAFAPEAFRASAEYARNFGGDRLIKEHKDTGYMVKADIAADIKAVTARGTFYYTKNFVAFGNYNPGLLVGQPFGGNMLALAGVRMFNLGFDVKPADKWTVSLDGYSFQSRTGHDQILEADLTAKYAHNENVELFAGAGYAKFPKDEFEFRDNFKYQAGMLIKF